VSVSLTWFDVKVAFTIAIWHRKETSFVRPVQAFLGRSFEILVHFLYEF